MEIQEGADAPPLGEHPKSTSRTPRRTEGIVREQETVLYLYHYFTQNIAADTMTQEHTVAPGGHLSSTSGTRKSRFQEHLTQFDPDPKPHQPRGSLHNEATEPREMEPPSRSTSWRYTFLLVLVAYLGVSGYIGLFHVYQNLDSLVGSAAGGGGQSTSTPAARALISRAENGMSDGS